MDTRVGAYVHDVVGGAHHLLIVLDDHHRIPQVTQTLDDTYQPLGVALVQAYAGLVEHVERADEATAKLGGERHALALPAREAIGEAV